MSLKIDGSHLEKSKKYLKISGIIFCFWLMVLILFAAYISIYGFVEHPYGKMVYISWLICALMIIIFSTLGLKNELVGRKKKLIPHQWFRLVAHLFLFLVALSFIIFVYYFLSHFMAN